MSKIMDAIRRNFDDAHWNYSYEESDQDGDEVIRMGMRTKQLENCRTIVVGHGNEGFTVYSISPVKVPEEARLRVAEYLTRANYALTIGNFELDFSDGEVRYKVTNFCGDIDLDQEVIDRQVGCGYSMMDRYFPGIMKVMYSGVSPADAIEEAENPHD